MKWQLIENFENFHNFQNFQWEEGHLIQKWKRHVYLKLWKKIINLIKIQWMLSIIASIFTCDRDIARYDTDERGKV